MAKMVSNLKITYFHNGISVTLTPMGFGDNLYPADVAAMVHKILSDAGIAAQEFINEFNAQSE